MLLLAGHGQGMEHAGRIGALSIAQRTFCSKVAAQHAMGIGKLGRRDVPEIALPLMQHANLCCREIADKHPHPEAD